ncbi:hypothetical protein THERMOS_198 [Bathymodiolus thermophilus thioautotrophic gill symbiont]|uniref:Uncharacterized protein n=1 Tax=Bathymodiolus thermophilus thioautotrophic gill symbiont TaxID=2360 RepID=A0A8H8XC44_9GAMM|nr:hypothetical protein THERMOS_198 [Bathymodiolus thermophilus thioautotrophic gill symbiont]
MQKVGVFLKIGNRAEKGFSLFNIGLTCYQTGKKQQDWRAYNLPRKLHKRLVTLN